MIKSKREFNMRTLPVCLLLTLLSFTACQTGTTNNEEEATTDEQQDPSETQPTEYTIAPFPESTAYPEARMEDMSFQDGQFEFTYANYELKMQTPDAESKMCANSDQGQHIHLIVDTLPYAAKYEGSFAYEIEDGEHYILAFLSRSYHESIKNGQADILRKVTIADNTITNSAEVTDPMLFYSRPKGTYVGKANTERIMLDFWLHNVELGEDYQVKAQVNDQIFMIDEWQPYFLTGLPMGDNTITLTLVDGEGNPVDTPLNPVTRTFTLQADPAEKM